MTTRVSPVTLERIPYDPAAWDATIAGHPGAEVFHSSAWIEYLALSQGAEPVVALVRAGGRAAGFFVGAIVRRFGLRILGSPMRGWATQSMGFLLESGSDRRSAAEALPAFAFRELGCVHVELADRNLTAGDMAGSAYAVETGRSFRIDLHGSEAQVFGGVRRTTRQEIRKAQRAGLCSEIALDDEFAAEFHGYLTKTFARQGLVPTYGIDRVRQLIHALRGSGQLLTLRVRSPEGATLGTGISVGRNRTAVAWGMAFDRTN